MLTKTVFSYNVNNIKTDFCYLHLKITEKGGIMEDKQMNPLGETVTESVAPVAATTAADGTGYAQMPKSKWAGDVVGRFWKLRIASAVAPVAFLTLALVGVLIMFAGNTSVDYAYILAGIFGAIAASLVSVALAVQSKNKPVNAALMVAMTLAPGVLTLGAMIATIVSVGTVDLLTVDGTFYAVMVGLCHLISLGGVSFPMAVGCGMIKASRLMHSKKKAPLMLFTSAPSELSGDEVKLQKQRCIENLAGAIVFGLFIIVAPVALLFQSSFTDPLRSIDNVSLGDYISGVKSSLGDVYEHDGDIYTWYDGEYTKLLKESQQLQEKMLGAESAEDFMEYVQRAGELATAMEFMTRTEFTVVFGSKDTEDADKAIRITYKKVVPLAEGDEEVVANNATSKLTQNKKAEDGNGFYVVRKVAYSDDSWTMAYELVVISDIEYDAASGIYTVTEEYAVGTVKTTFTYSATASEWRRYGFDNIERVYQNNYADAAA